MDERAYKLRISSSGSTDLDLACSIGTGMRTCLYFINTNTRAGHFDHRSATQQVDKFMVAKASLTRIFLLKVMWDRLNNFWWDSIFLAGELDKIMHSHCVYPYLIMGAACGADRMMLRIIYTIYFFSLFTLLQETCMHG